VPQRVKLSGSKTRKRKVKPAQHYWV